MKRKLAAMESENVMLQDNKQASDEACQRLQIDMKTAKEEFSKVFDEMKRKLAAMESENVILHDKVQASHEATTSKVEFNKEFDEMTRKLAAMESENVALRDKLRDMVEAYQKVQNHMNATGALLYNVVKSEAWAAYKTTTAMDGTNMVVLHAITAMPQYEQKSFEELRLEYYNKASNISGAPSEEREESTLNFSSTTGALRGNLIVSTFLGVKKWVTVILLVLVAWFKDYLSKGK
jgi:DNA polymerase sigma